MSVHTHGCSTVSYYPVSYCPCVATAAVAAVQGLWKMLLKTTKQLAQLMASLQPTDNFLSHKTERELMNLM
jgi:hypothetical protein